MARSLATYGIYPSMSALHTGAEALKADGFRQTDISLLYSDDCCASKAVARDALARAPQSVVEAETNHAHARTVLGYLAGIGALTLPGIGPLLAAGPLVNVFTGLGPASAATGLIDALVALGLDEHEARRYEGCLKEGRILLSVNCDDDGWVGRARNILTRTGAEHLAAAAEMESAFPS